jgi:hypothetical protein
VLFDICLGALVRAVDSDGQRQTSDKWKYSSYKARRKLFASICRDWLKLKFPENSDRLLELLDTSDKLLWQRNIITHGNYGYTIPPNSSNVVNCRAYSMDRNETLYFDEKILKTIHHDISHLTADLFIEFKKIALLEGCPFIIFSDSELLKIHRDTFHP